MIRGGSWAYLFLYQRMDEMRCFFSFGCGKGPCLVLLFPHFPKFYLLFFDNGIKKYKMIINEWYSNIAV